MNTMLPYYKRRLAEVLRELQILTTDRASAGINTIGQYELQVKNLKEERARLEKDILEEESRYKTPEENQIFFYILVSTKEKVKKNLGQKCFCQFEGDRYHPQEQKEWRPYKDQPRIEDLLKDIRKGYNFTPIYLDGQIASMHWRNLDNEIQRSVSVIDVFSLNASNRLIAAKFDTRKAGVLLPLCRTLRNDLVNEYKKIREGLFNSLNAANETDIPSAYYFDISTAERFKLDLKRIFRQKFLIKNQAASDSQVRQMNFNLQ